MNKELPDIRGGKKTVIGHSKHRMHDAATHACYPIVPVAARPITLPPQLPFVNSH